MNRKSLLLTAVLLLAACSRGDYFTLLSNRGLDKYYLAPDTNPSLSLSLEIAAEADGRNRRKLILPKGTNTESLVASYDIRGYSLFVDGTRQISGVTPHNFSKTNTLRYSLYSYDGKSEDYTVEVIVSNACFKTFGFTADDNPALENDIIAENDGLTGNDTGDKDVKDRIDGNSVWFWLTHDISLKGLVPSFTFEQEKAERIDGAKIKEQQSSQNFADFSSPQIYRVHAADGTSVDYQVSAYRLTSFTFYGNDNGFKDDYEAHIGDDEITVQLPYTAKLSALSVKARFLGDTIDIEGMKFTDNEAAGDFSKERTLTVATATGLSHSYTLKVTKADSPDDKPQNTPNNPKLPDGSGNDSDYDPASGTSITVSGGSGGGNATGGTITRYRVSYDANGADGTLPEDTETYRYNAKVTAKDASSLSRSLYIFAGWNSSSDGSGAIDVAADGVFTMPAGDVVLYAKWTQAQAEGLSVSYYMNGGTGVAPQDTALYRAGDSVTAKEGASFSRSGYTFAGWTSSADGTGSIDTAAGANFTMPGANVTLYAKWKANEYAIHFNSTGGSSVADLTWAYGSTITRPADPTLTSYNFAGWYKDSGLLNQWNFDTDTVSGETTLYAKWTAKLVTAIVFNSTDIFLGASITTKTITYTIEPSDAANKTLSWQSSDTSVVTVSNGDITCIANGTATITATSCDGTNISAHCTVTVDTSKYEIATAADLAGINSHLNEDYKLTADINLEGKEWSPIGTFTGVFDGNGHSIYDYKTTGPGKGLFSKNEGTIKNLVLKDVAISCSTGGEYVNIGALAAQNSGTIENCSVISGFVNANNSGTAGGLVGYNSGGTIRYCHSTIPVTGATNTGGLVGCSGDNGLIEYCYYSGTVTGTASAGPPSERIGGLVGSCENGGTISTVRYSYSTGRVTSTGATGKIGGLIGECGYVENCYSTSIVDAPGRISVGGLVGDMAASVTITNCYSIGTVDDTGGGLVGKHYTGKAIRSYYNSDNKVDPDDTNSGSAGKITGWMTDATNYATWNFTTVWAIDTTGSNFNGRYPYLRKVTLPSKTALNLEALFTGGALSGGTNSGAEMMTDRKGASNAYNFPNFNSNIDFGTGYASLFNDQKPYSISVWCRIPSGVTGTDYYQILTQNGGADWLFEYALYYDSDKKFKVQVNQAGKNIVYVLERPSAAEDAKDVWHHLVFIYDNAQTVSEFSFYIDGTLVDTDNYMNDITLGAAGFFKLGTDVSSNGFKGAIDDLRIYGRALTAGEVTALYYE